MLLLALRLDQTILSDALPAYPAPGGVILPLGEVTRLLSLAIAVDPARGSAEGFFISENRGFNLDVAAQIATVEGKQQRFEPSNVEVHQDDIYIDTRLLSTWLPLDFTVDLYGSLVSVHPREPLPLQLQQKRQKQIQTTLANLGYGGPRYPRVGNTYRLFDGPFIDQSLRLSLLPNESGGRSGGVQYSTFAAADLLYTEANLYLFGDNAKRLSDFRLSLGRKDPDAELLGLLKAREVTVGEVLYPGLDLVSLPFSGPGVLLSSFPLQQQTQFDRQTFVGDLPQGWEVELYQNEALIDFQQSRSDGLYQFKDVPLLFGLNAFRLVFYGSQGQRREETRRFNVGTSLVPPGKLFYRLAANDPKNATKRGLFDLEFGFSKHFSSSLGVAGVGLEDGQHQYGKVGLRGFWNLIFAHLDFAADRTRGTAVEAGLQTRLGALGLSLQNVELHDFVSEVFRPVLGPIRRRSTLGANTVIRFSPFFSVPLTLDLQRDRLRTGQNIDRISNRISTFSQGWFVSNRLNWTLVQGSGSPIQPLGTGSFLISRFLRQLSLRGEAFYELDPRKEVTDLTLTVETRVIPGYLFQAGVNRILRSAQNRYTLSVNKSEGNFAFGLTAEYARPQGLSLGLNLFVGLSRDPRTGHWSSQARPVAGSGAASALAFLDTDGNGVMDAGEKPIEGAGFFVNRAGTSAKTGSNGLAFLSNLPSYQDSELSLSPATLEDPLWVPEREGIRFVPRAGKATRIDFPVLVTGEITGTAYIRREGKTHEVGGAQLQLVDAQGKTLRNVRTAYDGFYDLTQIPPGRYTLGLAPEEIARLKITKQTLRSVEIGLTGTIIDGLNFIAESESLGSPGTQATVAALPPATAEKPLAAPGAGLAPQESAAFGVASTREEWLRRAEHDLQRVKQEPKTRYAIQLQFDCEVASLLEGWKHDLPSGSMWLLPVERGGRACFRVFWGRYASQREARQGASVVPPFFTTSRNRPGVVALRKLVTRPAPVFSAKPEGPPPASAPEPTTSRGEWLKRAERDLQQVKQEPETRYAIQLQLDCEVASLLEGWKHDLPSGSMWLLPVEHGGRTCFRVFWGRYPSFEAAEQALPSLPRDFQRAPSQSIVVSVTKILASAPLEKKETAKPEPTPEVKAAEVSRPETKGAQPSPLRIPTHAAAPVRVTREEPPATPTPLPTSIAQQPTALPTPSPAGLPVTVTAAPGPGAAPSVGKPAPTLEDWLQRAEAERARLIQQPATRYAIQLEAVCDAEALNNAWKRDQPSGSLWVLPLRYGGRTCFRVLWGRYASRQAAQRDLPKIPPGFNTPDQILNVQALVTKDRTDRPR